jgi:23S rRNA pseudouridine2457 synthase
VARLIHFNKRFAVLSQFTDDGTGPPRRTLAEFIDGPGVYPAGRLDFDSEGLMALCDDGRLQARIADPRFKLPKTYLVQVEGEPGEPALDRLRRGIELKDGTRGRPKWKSSPILNCGRAIRRSACARPFPTLGSG